MIRTAAFVAAAGLASIALAGNSYSGGGGAIPDNGGPGNPFSSTVMVGDSFAVADVTVDLIGMNHTWVGDLIITLSHNATSVSLSDRPGVPEVSGVGFSWNLAGNYSFDDAASNGTFQSIGVQASAFTLASGSYLSESALSAFDGQNSSGAWTLTISDNAGLEIGSLQGWRLNLAPVPAPSAIAMLGLTGLAATRRRR